MRAAARSSGVSQSKVNGSPKLFENGFVANGRVLSPPSPVFGPIFPWPKNFAGARPHYPFVTPLGEVSFRGRARQRAVCLRRSAVACGYPESAQLPGHQRPRSLRINRSLPDIFGKLATKRSSFFLESRIRRRGPASTASAAPLRTFLMPGFMLTGASGLGQDLLHDVPMDIGQAEIAAAIAVGQLRVIEAELIENGGVQIVQVHLSGHG
jgi:hypothetical protein